ncbi:sensor histidine kinase [Hymenobacter volaticus]|uniref:Sensor histidine kinase n=1 Tax=Hymenobacter volaticus TaxID=2932254 RepID=A0ABY4GFZ5_9BACT|nr:histidine kinase [Hymenobacter volaticus]UOQ69234.1 sensor histidine kinase [Hymenobacter volaticus]
MTIRSFLQAYAQHLVLRVTAHLLLWVGLYGCTDDPDQPLPVLLRLQEWGYAAGSFYLLFYGPVRRCWERGRYAWPVAAVVAVGMGTGWLLYWQNRLAYPNSAFAHAYLPVYEQVGVLAILQSVRVFYYALLEGVLVNLAGPAALKIAKTLYERQLARHHLEQLLQRQQLALLQAQVSPHFLFNTLNNLYGLVLHDDARAPTFAQQVGALLRYTDEQADASWVSLPTEVQFIEDYLALTRLRYDQRVTVESHWHGELDLPVSLPPLLLLPLVENAVKHGLQPAIGPAWLRVEGVVCDGHLLFTVTNSVAAAPEPPVTGGLGLTTLRERLHLLYPSPSPLTLRPAATQFKAHLRLPLYQAPITSSGEAVVNSSLIAALAE